MKHTKSLLIAIAIATTASAFASVTLVDPGLYTAPYTSFAEARGRVASANTHSWKAGLFHNGVLDTNFVSGLGVGNAWASGVTKTWALNYVAATNEFTWRVEGYPAITRVMAPTQNFAALRIDAKASRYRLSTNSVIQVTDVLFNGAPIPGYSGVQAINTGSSVNTVGQLLYFTGPVADFELTGKTFVSYAGDASADDNLTFSIRSMQAVPEPGTIAAVVSGLAGMAALRRRRS